MIDSVDEIVAYDTALGKLHDGFSAIKKKKNSARTSAAPDDLFVVDKDTEKLSKESSIAFHQATLLLRLFMSASAQELMSAQLLHL